MWPERPFEFRLSIYYKKTKGNGKVQPKKKVSNFFLNVIYFILRPDEHSFGIYLNLLSNCEKYEMLLSEFEKIKVKLNKNKKKPSEFIYNQVLHACSKLKNLKLAWHYFEEMQKENIT